MTKQRQKVPDFVSSESFEWPQAAWMLPTKLSPQQQHVQEIQRPDLINSLHSGIDSAVTLIVSPAGYGKTTVLAQWREHLLREQITIAWLTLDEDDGEPLVFLSYLIVALARAGLNLGQLELAAVNGLVETPRKLVLAAMINAITEQPARTVIMLDDYHRIQSDEVDQMLETLIANLPQNLHVVIATREPPNLELAGLRTRGQLSEFSAAQLRFSELEARQVLSPTVSDASLQSLMNSTEGWPVALQLANLWLQHVDDPASLVEEFSGRTSNVADYLAEQVLKAQTDSVRSFLLKTSILDRFSGDLANAVCDRTDSWEILRDVGKLNSLLVPLDNEQKWFRYHHLFAEYLQDLLRRTEGDNIEQLHQAASRWLLEHDFVAEAVKHARLAGKLDEAAKMIESYGLPNLIAIGGIGLILRLLKNFTSAELSRFPRLQLVQAFLCTKLGDLGQARAIFDGVRFATADFSPTGTEADAPLQRDGDIMGIMLWIYEDGHLDTQYLADLKHKAEHLYANDSVAQSVVWNATCPTALAIGDMVVARKMALCAIDHMRATDTVLGVNYCLLHLGLALHQLGKRREAEATFSEAQVLAADNFGVDSGLKSICDVLLAGVHYDMNDLPVAAELLQESLEHIEQFDSWLDIYASSYQTAIGLAFAQDGCEAALLMVERGLRLARARRFGRLRKLMQWQRARCLIRAGKLRQATESITRTGVEYQHGEWRVDPFQWRNHFGGGIVHSMLAIENNDVAKALSILEDLQAACEAGSRRRDQVQVLILRSCAYWKAGNKDKALEAVNAALSLAVTEEIRRPFLDEGEQVEGILRHALRDNRRRGSDSLNRKYIAELLEALRQDRDRRGVQGQAFILSPREVDVMVELGQGLANKEIARALDMTGNTVKFHLKNIYAKLEVQTRARAIVVAREKSLID